MKFTCPHCYRNTTIAVPNVSDGVTNISTIKSKLGFTGIKHRAVACPHELCKELSLLVALVQFPSSNDQVHNRNSSMVQEWKLLPDSCAKPQPDYIPAAICDDYYEACSILSLSPRASATLSRRCLQEIVRDFWEISEAKYKDLGTELYYVKDKIDPDTWGGIEAIISVGDIGAHMEKDVNFIVEVATEEAGLLIELIEMLLEDWYVVREHRRERTDKAKRLSALKVAEKSNAKASIKGATRQMTTK